MTVRLGTDLSWAVFSEEENEQKRPIYRYEIGRVWAKSLGTCTFVMLNPSTADHQTNDLTITKCMGFAKRWGYGGIVVVNLFAFRATDPHELVRRPPNASREWPEYVDPVGSKNDVALIHAFMSSTRGSVIAAWGNPPSTDTMFVERMKAVEFMYAPWLCLGVTATGKPKHPSRIGYDTKRQDLVECRRQNAEARPR